MKPESHIAYASPKEVVEINAVLLDRARKGDEKAFNQIVRNYQDLVFNFSFKVCRNRDFAEETVQDTFVNVFRNLKQFDGRSKFTTWLYSIVANNCLMKRRRTKLEKASVSIDAPQLTDGGDSQEEPLTSWQKTPLDETMRKELSARLDEAIQKLPLDYRLVFILRDLEGKSAEETARIVKLTVSAVKSRLHRARVFLRDQLNEFMVS